MKHDLHRKLDDAAWDGDHVTVAGLLGNPGVYLGAHHSTALLHAAHRGNWRCVELLIPVSNPKSRNSEALWRAARYRHRRATLLLVPVSDTTFWQPWMWAELGPRAEWIKPGCYE